MVHYILICTLYPNGDVGAAAHPTVRCIYIVVGFGPNAASRTHLRTPPRIPALVLAPPATALAHRSLSIAHYNHALLIRGLGFLRIRVWTPFKMTKHVLGLHFNTFNPSYHHPCFSILIDVLLIFV